jgi:hypothetical protein
MPNPAEMTLLRSALLAALTGALLALPATAGASPDTDKLRAAVDELWVAKAAAKPAQTAGVARATKAMKKCRSKGPGWKRVRKVRDASQRRLYANGARILWRDLSELAEEGARYRPVRAAMGSYVNRLESAGITDPVLAAGVAAQRRRLAIQDSLVALGTCKVFESRLKRVRSIRRKGRAQAHFDSLAGAVYSGMARYIEKKRNAADRQFSSQLETAFDRLIALGETDGEANGFLYALSIAR